MWVPEELYENISIKELFNKLYGVEMIDFL